MNWDLRRTLYGHLFILPWLAGFMLFTLYPILATLYFSFTDYNVLGTPRWVGLQNDQFGHACAMARMLFLITLLATYGVWKVSLGKAFQEG